MIQSKGKQYGKNSFNSGNKILIQVTSLHVQQLATVVGVKVTLGLTQAVRLGVRNAGSVKSLVILIKFVKLRISQNTDRFVKLLNNHRITRMMRNMYLA